MSEPEIDDAGIAAGRALVDAPLTISEEDRRRVEEAWNSLAAFDIDDAGITAGYVPKPTVDPNRTLVPSEEEIAKLPRLARFAFAMRCAHRVLLMQGEVSGVEHTAPAAEVARFAEAAVRSLLRVVTVGTLDHLTAPARDFERLVKLAEKEKWTDDTPVPQSVFGPMWEGPPPYTRVLPVTGEVRTDESVRREGSPRDTGTLILAGVVTNSYDGSGQGKVLVHIPSINQEVRARLLAPSAGSETHLFHSPHPGDKVLIAIDQSNPVQAFVVGALRSTTDRPSVRFNDVHVRLPIELVVEPREPENEHAAPTTDAAQPK
ncbi:MAG: hypothetical protein J0I06_06855 [Planctomycetes bacterium]|nr:hypothetical protein [Planctomycetota bacterium]